MTTSTAYFCVGVHDEVKQFDADVQAEDSNGVARFFADDGFSVATAKAVRPCASRRTASSTPAARSST